MGKYCSIGQLDTIIKEINSFCDQILSKLPQEKAENFNKFQQQGKKLGKNVKGLFYKTCSVFRWYYLLRFSKRSYRYCVTFSRM